jgi:PIN domain nuclease of toxin-antitoxin system
MQYLLDMHTFIWFSENDKLLSRKAAREIVHIDNKCFLSLASLWEIAIKSHNGKLNIKIPFREILAFLQENRIEILQIQLNNLYTLLNLELIHRYPFDRIIVAQAITNDLTILTVDKDIVKYPVKCLW